MNITDWLPYALPLREPWATSRGVTQWRCGRLLRQRDADGRSGWGDCTPLPDFGIDEARATAFAEECAHLDLLAQAAGLSLDAWLNDNAPGAAPVSSIAVNASLGSLSALRRETLRAAGDAGFRIIKLKVGLAAPEDELRRLQELSDALPAGGRWRLDANGAWSVSAAASFLAGCRDLPVEACEEPLREPDARTLARLQDAVPFAIAVDESLARLGAEVFRQPPVRRIVIKPARQGSLLGSLEIARRARAAGLEVIVSSALESSCGLLACAHLAAAVAPETVHGLATAAWFVCDTGKAPPIEGGRLIMPGAPGIGFVWTGEAAAAFTAAGQSTD